LSERDRGGDGGETGEKVKKVVGEVKMFWTNGTKNQETENRS